MKLYQYISICCLAAVMLSACSDFLNDDLTGQLTTDSNLSSKEVAESTVNGTYVDLRGIVGYTDWGKVNNMALEYITGKSFSFAGSQSNFTDYQDLTYHSRDPFVEGLWTWLYRGVNKCNFALYKLPQLSMLTEAELNKYTGEVKALRAYYYFFLVRMWGDVPKVTDLYTSLNDVYVSRSPAKEIYDEIIIPDLLDAEKMSLPWKDETGRVSMGMVKALLADVYLTYAGYPIKAGDTYYTESAKRSKELIDQNVYSLFTSYDNLHLPAQNNKTEFIFQIQFAKDVAHNYMALICAPYNGGIAVSQAEYGSLTPTEEFLASFDPGDKRRQDDQFFFSSATGYPADWAGQTDKIVTFPRPLIYKFYDQVAIKSDNKSNLNYTLYRYADVLLMYAEAANRASGTRPAQADQCLKLVRDRAELSELTGLNQDDFEKAVWRERVFELCFETKMWFDVLRTRQIWNDTSKSFENVVGHTTVYGKTFQTKNLLYPIPERERDNNKNLTQNDGF